MKNRLQLLDSIRGISLISMILYHAVWDLVYIYDIAFKPFRGTLGYIWQQSICWSFIFISGFCLSLGRNKLKRGLITFCAGIIITVITLVFMPENKIIFGILTFLGTATLVTIPLERPLNKIMPEIGTALSLVLFFILRNVNVNYLGFENLKFLKLPRLLYANYVTAFLGFPPKDFVSTDYFSLLPWIFLYFTGYFCFKLFEKHSLTCFLEKGKVPVLSFIGRNTLIIYLVHQPLLYAFFRIILK